MKRWNNVIKERGRETYELLHVKFIFYQYIRHQMKLRVTAVRTDLDFDFESVI